MKSVILSYSYTGNNNALAESVAKELSVEHLKITEATARSMGKIVFDMLFNRTPAVTPEPAKLQQYDHIIFVGPVWMGQPASPLRGYFNYLKTAPKKYSFVSISGGALNPNPKLAPSLEKKTGAKPEAFIDLHISDFLPSGNQSTAKETSSYKLNEEDIKKLTKEVVAKVKPVFET